MDWGSVSGAGKRDVRDAYATKALVLGLSVYTKRREILVGRHERGYGPGCVLDRAYESAANPLIRDANGIPSQTPVVSTFFAGVIAVGKLHAAVLRLLSNTLAPRSSPRASTVDIWQIRCVFPGLFHRNRRDFAWYARRPRTSAHRSQPKQRRDARATGVACGPPRIAGGLERVRRGNRWRETRAGPNATEASTRGDGTHADSNHATRRALSRRR